MRCSFDFTGSSGIVSGGASGIGRAVVAALLESGAKVVAVDRNAEGLAELAGELSGGAANGADRLLTIACDLTDPPSAGRAVSHAADRFGTPDYLVNSIAVSHRKAALDLSEEEIGQMIEVNFFAVFRLCRLVAREMSRAAPAHRAIVNIASTGAWQGSRNYAGYNASKAALVTATRVLANEWISHGIHVNALCPGPTRTPFVERYYADHPEVVESIIGRTPAGRIAEPADHVGPVLFLLSDASSWITGEAVASDGGKGLNG
ncbi:MAG TPA: SDR family oxidoreductase [Spirochaetia bacterium]|nr:SDR family oxidoreductase [Spirochaetia bacterium]